jgi:hypothetical protein
MIAPAPDRGERIEGFPEPLPPGERLLWQGHPDRSLLARHVFHAHKIAAYFGALVLLRAAWLLASGTGDAPRYGALVVPIVLGAIAVGTSWLLAHLTARSTVYAVTEKRLAMRIGIVVPFFFNMPLRLVDGVSLRHYRGAGGDVAVALGDDGRLAWLHLWPHVRAWRLARPEPTLRALPDAELVGRLLAVTAKAVAGEGTVATAPAPAAARAAAVRLAPPLAAAPSRIAPPAR